MRGMKLRPQHLDQAPISLNIVPLIPDLLPMLEVTAAKRITVYATNYIAATGDLSSFDEIDVRAPLQWAAVGNELPAFLAGLYPELYGPTGPVSLGEPQDILLNNGQGEQVIACDVSVDGRGLYRLAAQYGPLKVDLEAIGASRDEMRASFKTDGFLARSVRMTLVLLVQTKLERDVMEAFDTFFGDGIESRISFPGPGSEAHA